MISKKKVYSVALASALTFTAIAPLASTTLSAANVIEGTVTSHSLTVRTGPSANYAASDWISKGDKVTVLKNHGDFSYIQYGNKKGYVSDSYLNKVTKTVSTAIATQGTVTASSLTVRNGASANHKAIDWLKKGDKVTVIKGHGKFLHVQYGNKKGYVHENYLKLTKVTVATPSASVLYQRYVNVKANDTLNMRKGASVSHSVVSKLKNGSKVDVYKVTGDWAHVGFNNTKGYVHTAYLKTSANTPVTSKPTPISSTAYKVKAGDTLWRISAAHKTTVANLKSLNGLKNDKIRVGQTLKVNGKVSPGQPVQQVGVLKGKEIVIDPGHGGRFAGAHGYVIEEDVNLQIALKLRNELEALGATVIMTRATDVACTPAGITYAADLTCRPGVAKKNNSHMFISIHSNAGVAGANGTEVYWYSSNRDAKLAKLIQKEIVSDVGLKDRGAKYGNFSVLRNSGSTIPSVLVETGFVTNTGDAAVIGNGAKQTVMAKAMKDAIVEFWK